LCSCCRTGKNAHLSSIPSDCHTWHAFHLSCPISFEYHIHALIDYVMIVRGFDVCTEPRVAKGFKGSFGGVMLGTGARSGLESGV
jgi:hypothetical protein